MVFGIVWLIDGAFKFQPGLSDGMVLLINGQAQSQPTWLLPWFNFWSQTVSSNPQFFVYSIGLTELAVAFTLIFGVVRKIAYSGGLLLSLVIWSVPEGFGGPYGPNSTDIGTGVIYAFVFTLLLIVNATYGPSKYSLDYYLEKHWSSWKKIAEVRNV